MSNGVASSSASASSSKAPPPTPSSAPEAPLRPLYHESSQFRHWRYSKEQLTKMRKDLNERAVSVVRSNIKAEKKAQSEWSAFDGPSTSANGASSTPPPEVVYLTVDDELSLIAHYVSVIPQTAAGLGFTKDAEATAILYLKRFYLVNTCMDYHPRSIMPTCLFLACKAEGRLLPVDEFVGRFNKLTSEEVLKLEFLVAQSLGFEFKVHHPHTALHGFMLDFQSIPSILALPSPSLPQLRSLALTTLSSLALALDLSLIYSPSQIALAAVHYNSPEHSTLYLKTKEESSTNEAGRIISETELGVLEGIIAELRAAETKRSEDEGGKKRLAKVKEVDKRLRSCANPERAVGSALYRKRAAEEEAEEASKRAKKSQKAAEAHRKDIDVFGGDLQVIVPQTGEGTRAVLEDVPGGAMGDGAGEED